MSNHKMYPDKFEKRKKEHFFMFTVNINTAWCKGCGICAAFCPKKVIEIKSGKACATGEGCIGCRLCELRCPDLAIEVEGERK